MPGVRPYQPAEPPKGGGFVMDGALGESGGSGGTFTHGKERVSRKGGEGGEKGPRRPRPQTDMGRQLALVKAKSER